MLVLSFIPHLFVFALSPSPPLPLFSPPLPQLLPRPPHFSCILNASICIVIIMIVDDGISKCGSSNSSRTIIFNIIDKK